MMQDEDLGRLVALIATWVLAGANAHAGMEVDREVFESYANHTIDELMGIAVSLGEARGVTEQDVMAECKRAIDGACEERAPCH